MLRSLHSPSPTRRLGTVRHVSRERGHPCSAGCERGHHQPVTCSGFHGLWPAAEARGPWVAVGGRPSGAGGGARARSSHASVHQSVSPSESEQNFIPSLDRSSNVFSDVLLLPLFCGLFWYRVVTTAGSSLLGSLKACFTRGCVNESGKQKTWHQNDTNLFLPVSFFFRL